MNNLYDVVQKTIEAPTIEEASNIIFGTNDILVNSKEYYETVVSSFIKKKEIVIQSRGNELIFNLDDINNLWSCVFIGEYLRKELEEIKKDIINRISEVDKKINKITDDCKNKIIENKEGKRRKKPLVNEKRELSRKLNGLEECKKGFFEQTSLLRVKLENSIGVEEEELKRIRENIKSIHIIRNSIQHGSSDMAVIKNYNNEIRIPIEYLDGFNKGRIIAREGDQVVFEKTNEIIAPVLEKKGYDIKKVESFFYKVHPEYLSFLLDHVNNAYDELYKLKYYIFFKHNNVKELVNKYSISLKDINQLPKEAVLYSKPENVAKVFQLFDIADIKEFKPGVFYYPDSVPILLQKFSLEEMKKLPEVSFAYPYKTLEVIEKFGEYEKITDLPYGAFKNVTNALKIFDKRDAKALIKLPTRAFVYPTVTSNLIDFLGYEKTCEIPDYAWNYFSNLESVVKNLDFEIVKQLPPIAFKYSPITFKLINEKNLSVEEIKKIPEDIYHKADVLLEKCSLDELILYSKKFKYVSDEARELSTRLSLEELEKLPKWAFMEPQFTLDLYDKIGLDKIIELDVGNGAFEFFDLLKKLFNNYEYEKIKKFPREAFYHLNNTMDYIDKYGIDMVLSFAPSSFGYPEAFDTLIKEFGIEKAKDLPIGFFYEPKLAIKLLEKFSVEEIASIPSTYFILNKDLSYELSNTNICIPKLSEKLFNSEKVKVANIEKLLQIVDNDYDKLKEFPIEFFECQLSMLDELYKEYNSNVARSIFGINDPKIIAAFIYFHSVFKNYEGIPEYYNEIDINVADFMNLCVSDTYEYRNNFDESNRSVNSNFTKQFTEDSNGNIMDSLSMKKNLLRKLRNSSAHFRFKPVKDKNGNIVPNKVYLYDKFEESDSNNFNIIIDIEELIRITRKVELGLEMSNTKVDIANSQKEIHRNSTKYYGSYKDGNRFIAEEALEKWDDALEDYNNALERKKDIEEKGKKIR